MTQLSGPILAADLPRATTWSDLYQLAKPRLTMLVVITTAIGFGIANPAQWSWLQLIGTLLGTTLACIGAGMLNQVCERQTDALMRRTMDRPLPAGRMTVRFVFRLGMVCALTGVGMVVLTTNWLAAALVTTTVVTYVLCYTPMKRTSSASTIVGAFPGALPPVIGYAAAAGTLGPGAWALFSLQFLWQLPHFLAIAWLYRDQYARAGLPLLPVTDPSGATTFRQILLGCMALLPLGLVPTMLGISGVIYFFVALAAGVMFLGFGVALIIGRTRRCARAMFLASLVYLPLVYTFMLMDRV